MKQRLVKPVPLPLFSADHINYYSFIYGVKFGKLLKKWRDEQKKNRLRRRFSVDSPECSTSQTTHTASSQEIPSQSSQPKSRSAVQSPSSKASTLKSKPTATSKSRTTNTQVTPKKDTKSPCKTPRSPRPISQDKTTKNNASLSKPCSDVNKESINIHVNPLSTPIFQKQSAIVTKVGIKKGELSIEKQQSFDSTEHLPQNSKSYSHPELQPSTSYSQPEYKRRERSTSFESLSGISTDLLYDYFVKQQQLAEKPEFQQDVTDCINTELRYALSQSIPISSETVYEPIRYYPAVQDGLSCPPSHEVTPKKKQRSVSVQLEESPPSPAPGTPVVSAHRRTRSCGRADDFVWMHEGSWPNPNPPRVHFEFGPRVVYLESVGSKQVLRNKSSFADRKCHSNQSPAQKRSFAEKVYEQFYRRKKESEKKLASKMNSIDDHERKIIIEFCHLLEKSKQLFNGLRELPQYGHKQWSMYFGRTFDIYTRLWKYQQQHRAILDSKYGMKRWQIGEIASKIGQLYYHFYLRTSETGYLNEAYSFYYAIRGRCYYTKANKEDKCELMVKKLRYYARFIVVCLLLKKMKLVKDLIKELDRQIIEYGNTYDPDDQVEWTVVVDEVKAFIHAEPVVAVIDPDNYSVIISNRLTPMTTPAIERTPQMTLTLQEILIVGSSSQQVKFSELTMDMFRMLQTLEREPTGDIPRNVDESPRARYTHSGSAHNPDGMDPNLKQPNPHKYLLFKPSPSQILVYLASGFHDLPGNGALLLYISADGHLPQAPVPKHADDIGYDMGGLITTSKNDIYRDCRDPKAPASSKSKELQCLYPGDLYPFTRRPFFIIVDSDNSYAFQNIPRHFGQPLVILMSPLELPASFHDRRQQGSLFTLFLHSPLTAFCYCSDISNIALVHWDHGQHVIDNFIAEASALLIRSRVDISYISFLGDDFLRLLILRYMFCEVVLRLHRGFRARSHLTRCSPALPEELLEHPTLIQIVMDLAAHLQVRSHFHEPSLAAGPPTTKE